MHWAAVNRIHAKMGAPSQRSHSQSLLATGAFRVPVTVRIKIAGGMSRMVVMLTGDFLLAIGVPMSVRIEVAGGVASVVVMLARFFFRHVHLLCCQMTTCERSFECR